MPEAPNWNDVDTYLVDTLDLEDDVLRAVRSAAHDAGLPMIEVAPNQGALLALLASLSGGRRALEVGTLAGYSTVWLSRGAEHVTTLELDPEHAKVAQANLERAGIADRVDLLVGPAVDSLAGLVARQVEAYDLVFIDADKPGNPQYLAAALQLTRPGSLIVVDNVVRNGRVVDPADPDPRVQGTRQVLELIGADPRLEATALQTVGSKGWDGFALARVR